MPRKIIRRFVPDHSKVKAQKFLRVFGNLLHDPNLWHLNRRSVSGAFAIGLFIAWMPVPSQMLSAAAVAIVFRVNLPIAVSMVWVTNPLTMPVFLFFAYRLGAWLLDVPLQPVAFEFSLNWVGEVLGQVWQPFLLGCLTIGSLSALLGYYGMQAFWRWYVVHQWQRKRARHKARKQAASVLASAPPPARSAGTQRR
jgi:uncharacterized protein (DUF2062 family)